MLFVGRGQGAARLSCEISSNDYVRATFHSCKGRTTEVKLAAAWVLSVGVRLHRLRKWTDSLRPNRRATIYLTRGSRQNAMPMKKTEGAQGLRTERGPRRSGWDPYEVWRTRVKTASRATQMPGEKFVVSGTKPIGFSGVTTRLRKRSYRESLLIPPE